MTDLHISSEAQLHYNDVDHCMQYPTIMKCSLRSIQTVRHYIATVSPSQTPTAC